MQKPMCVFFPCVKAIKYLNSPWSKADDKAWTPEGVRVSLVMSHDLPRPHLTSDLCHFNLAISLTIYKRSKAGVTEG